MNLCATCKHWRKFDAHKTSTESKGLARKGLCEKIGQPDRYWDDKLKDEQEEGDNGFAEVTDLSGCAALRTTEDFGCVLHEAAS